MANGKDGGKTYWLERPGSANKIWWVLIILCVLLTLADFVYEKHPHYAVEKLVGFYSVAGTVFSIVAVLVALGLRRFLMRKEDYYDDD